MLTVVTLSSCKSDEEVNIERPPNVDIAELRTSSYASDKDISYEEAERRLAMIDEASKLLPDMETYLRDSMTSSYFDVQDGELSLNVRTTLRQEEPSIMDEQLMQSMKSKTKLPVKMHFNSMKNAEAITSVLENEAAALFSDMKGVQGFGYNPKTDMISLNVYEPDEFKKDAWLNDERLQQISDMNIEIVFDSQPTATAAIIGGGDLNRIPANPAYDNLSACTAGFSAVRNGVYGVITAAHCGTENNELGTKLRYIGRDRTNRYDMTLTGYDSNPNTGRFHDLAFFEADDRTARALPVFFTDTSTDTKPFYPDTNVVVGMYACQYGRTTGFSCGDVINTTFANPNTALSGKGCASSLPCANTFVQVRGPSLKCKKGDSGGPVFGLLALGIASSCSQTNTGVFTLNFSPLKYASYIGATPLVAQ